MSTNNPNTFYFGPLIITGSTLQSADTGSATQYSGDFTGSLQGTSSFAISASWAPSAGGGGGTTPTYFTQNFGARTWPTTYATENISDSIITVDPTKKFRVDFWGAYYASDDFFGRMFTNDQQYGQPVMLWTDNWDGTKVCVNYGTSNGSNMSIRVFYPGSGSILQAQWKATNTLNGLQPIIFGTVTYLQ